MSSCTAYLKAYYNFQIHEPLNDEQIFRIDCFERIGKQFLSIIISSGLIRSQQIPKNRLISLALKKLQPKLIEKLRLKDKRELYRIFGLYCNEQINQIKDYPSLETQLMCTFLKIIDDEKLPKYQASPIISCLPPYFQSTQYTQSRKTSYFSNKNNQKKQQIRKQQLLIQKQISQSKQKLKKYEKQSINGMDSSKISQNDMDNSFTYEQTQEQKSERNRQLCQKHFIELVGYLQQLSSPQGELTYIWQHLKWQGFETSYLPQMNQHHQWICSAKIRLPPNMCLDPRQDDWLQRIRKSKNKKKARQLACMDLLKALYLQYPQVWLIYKHLREQKRLVIPPLQFPKEADQMQLIRNRKNYSINKQKIELLYRHNKTDIRKKMEGISAKAELNTLLQQLAGRVTSPKIQKKIVEGNNWNVPVKIEYKTYQEIQNNKAPQIFEKTIVHHNTKVAEEEAYMQAIIEMYEKNPELFEKIQSIKMAKNIVEPLKKLPLLRNAKQMK